MHTLYGASSAGVTVEAVEEVAGILPEADMGRLWDAIASNSFDRLEEEVDAIFLEGYATPTVVDHLLDHVVSRALSRRQGPRGAESGGPAAKWAAGGAGGAPLRFG